ncbi:hypothetical protein [uncultured Georgenia sp.]|uniref:hypothetical protein n=1 Tax=uncultured Georgenia sp. TaxID=378209 RepID=UPI002603C3D5|nr:hypothetical protein [uncultured Georgenia sp.]HLV05691.1 hypothetical protein [Actinomycetaceae bacterium]
MPIFRRPTRLPDPVAAHLPRGDRPLAAAPMTNGSWVVVARDALLVVGEDGLGQRTAWHEIETGVWDGDTRTFTITWADRERPEQSLVLEHDDVAVLTAALRERVQASVVHHETIEVGRTRVRATVRRREDGSLYSLLTAFGPLPRDEDVERQLDDLERRVREAVGLVG